jgi:hypothetical protein
VKEIDAVEAPKHNPNVARKLRRRTMYRFILKEMAEAVVKAGLVAEERQPAIQSALESCWQDRIASVWHVDDVLQEAPGLTEEEARKVLEKTMHYHNAEVGINWAVLRVHAGDLYGDMAFKDPEEEEQADPTPASRGEVPEAQDAEVPF